MLIKLSLIYNFKYFILAVYLRFGISSLFSDCWIFLVRFSYNHFRHTQIFSLSSAALLMPTMLLKHFQIKWKLIHVRLQIAVSIISLLSYCGNWSVSEELSNTKRNARNFVQSVKTSLMSYLCWLIVSLTPWQSPPRTRPWSARWVTCPLLLSGTGEGPAAGTALQDGSSRTVLILLEGLLCLLPDLPVLYTFLSHHLEYRRTSETKWNVGI